MNNALLYLGSLLAVALAALFAVPHFVDWNGYRGVFEEEASKVLGRDVRVGGAVNVRFLPTPFVRFEKVRLADPTGQTGEPFVRADSFTMRLSGPALLRGVLEANEIELQRPVLTLALDGNGGGNWSNVQIKPGALPFVPQDVALHSVKLVDGSIALFGSEAQLIGKAEAVNGEFSAEALKGPFKFKGQATWSGDVHDVKFATTVPEADGAIRIKSNVRATKSAATYMFDGRLENLSAAPKLTGELTGKLPIDTAVTAAAGQDKAAPQVFDLKSKVEATTSGAKVDEIALALDDATEPQLLSGTAAALWGKEQRLDIALTSKWLDLDKLSGAGQDSATFFRVKQLGLSSLRALAGGGAGTAGAKIDVEQVKLGGETAGGLRIDAESRGGTVHLSELKAGLPGGSRLDLTGDLKDDSGKLRFAGTGFVHGTNLSRLLGWAAKSGTALDVKADGAFSAEGRVLVDDTRFELTEASADLGGRPFSGDVVVSGDERRKVAVTIEGARLDSSELFPAMSASLEENLRRAFGFGSGPAKPDPAASPAASGAAPNSAQVVRDVSVRVLAGELKHGNQIFRNVDATVGLDGGNIRIPSAKFTTANGLAVQIGGRIDNAAHEPKGTLSYDIAGRTPQALNDFAAITGLSSVIPAARLATTSSAKLAGLLHLGARGPATADITTDGTVELTNISAQAEFDGGLQGWRNAPSHVRAVARAPALAPLLAAFGINGEASAQPDTHEAELVFASTGALATGAAAVADITAPGFEAAYKGRLAAPGDGPVTYAGVVKLKASDIADVMATAGLSSVKGLGGIPIEGDIDIKRDASGWSLSSRHVVAGGSALSGTAKFAANAEGPAALTADLRADKVTVAGLLAAISDRLPADTSADSATESSATKALQWPKAAFAFDMLSSIAGDVRLVFDTLTLQPGLSAHNGLLKIALAPGKASITSMQGHAAAGALSGAVRLTKASTGVSFDGTLEIEGANLEALGASAKGKAGVVMQASAEAQSPAALITALSGSGTVTLDGARLPVPGPIAGVDTVAAVLASKIANEPEAIAEALRAAAQAASTDLGSRTIPFVIVNGVAKLDPITLASLDGSATGITVVELASMAIDSAWRVAPLVPPLPQTAEQLPGWVQPPAKGPLPPASIVYTGQLANLKSLTVNAEAADMHRELSVRIVERHLEELERLKLQDQQRAKAELERRQAIEAERAAAVAAAAAAKAAAAAAATAAAAGQTPPVAAMPPVLPESAGTSAVAPAPGADANAAAAPNAAAATSLPAQESTITVEPDPQASAAAAAAAAAGSAAPIVPAGERPQPASRPQPARTAPVRAPPRRTSSDEVMRSLGGFP
jgi:uncharacterized protein involved in outer membrane biogenesis